LINVKALTKLSNTEFQSKVLDVSDISLVYYWPNLEIAEEKRNFMDSNSLKLSSYDINSYFIDCLEPSNKKICQGFSLPSVQLYVEKPLVNPYTHKKYRKSIPYSGEVSLSSLEKFISKNYPSNITKVTNQDELKKLLLTTATRPINVAIFVTEKTAISMMIRSIAYRFQNSLKCIYANSKLFSEILTLYSIDTSPVIGVIKFEDPAQFMRYNGSIDDRNEIISWLDQFSLVDNTDKSIKDEDKENQISSNSNNFAIVNVNTLESTIKSTSGAYMITIVDGNSFTIDSNNYQNWINISTIFEGNIKGIVLNCSAESKQSSTESKISFGKQLCVNKEEGQQDIAYYIIPYNKLHNKLEFSKKHFYAMTALSDAKETLIDSIPKNNIKHLTSEEAYQKFLLETYQAHKLGVVVLSKKSQISSVLHNAALTMSHIKQDNGEYVADIAFMSDPAKDFLKNVGNPKLPTIMSIVVDPQLGQGKVSFSFSISY
jgi:hypothetical protein